MRSAKAWKQQLREDKRDIYNVIIKSAEIVQGGAIEGRIPKDGLVITLVVVNFNRTYVGSGVIWRDLQSGNIWGI